MLQSHKTRRMMATVRSQAVLVVCISAVLIFSSCKGRTPTEPQLSSVSWAEDIDYLDSQFKANEYGFSSLVSPQKFDSALSYIKNSTDSLLDFEIYIELQELMASLNVAHINAFPPMSWQFHYLPVLTRVFSDGVYIIMADQQHASLLGKKIISIGGVPMQTVGDSLSKVISHENVYWLEDQLPSAISCVEVLKYYGFASNLSNVDLDVEGVGNVTLSSSGKSFNNSTSGLISVLSGKTVPLYMQNQSSYYWYTFLQDSKVLYIKYNACAEASGKSFSDFTNEIVAFIDSSQVEKVVVDLRNNGGGNSSVIDPLLSYLESSQFNQVGKLFVATDRGTFSSASMNSISLKQETKCILVGEPTGGKPNSYGEVRSLTLPHSRIIVEYCTKYFQQMTGDPASLFPDYDIEPTAQDYMNGNDPVLNFILSYH